MSIDRIQFMADLTQARAVLRPGASPAFIGEMESILGVTIPPSMRAILEVSNGFTLPDYEIFSVDSLPSDGVVGLTSHWRQKLDSGKLIAIARDSSGDAYVLLPDAADERGEYAVAKIDHETCAIMYIVASSFERFVWFVLDATKREHNSTDFFEQPWPVCNSAWIFEHDPHLASYRTEKLAEPTPAPVIEDKPLLTWEVSHPMISIVTPPAGNTFAAASLEGALELWNKTTGECVQKILEPTNGDSQDISMITSLAYLSDSIIVSGGGSFDHFGHVRFWDIRSGTLIKTITAHTDMCRIAVSPQGNLLATGSGDGTAKLWDITTGDLLHTLSHGAAVNQVAFSPDGDTLVSGGSELKRNKEVGQIKVWDVKTGNRKETFAGDNQGVYSVAYSPNGNLLAAGVYLKNGGTVEIWNLKNGEVFRKLPQSPDIAHSLAFSPQNEILACSTSDGVTIYDVLEGRLQRTLKVRKEKGITTGALCVAFANNSEILATMSDSTIRLWRLS